MSSYEQERPSGRHQVNIGHLVMGIALLAIVGVWGLVQSDTVTGDDIRWLLPIPWVLAGVVGLVATAITGPRRYAVRQTGWVGERSEEPEAPDREPLTTEATSQQADQPPTQPTAQPTPPPASPNADQQ